MTRFADLASQPRRHAAAGLIVASALLAGCSLFGGKAPKPAPTAVEAPAPAAAAPSSTGSDNGDPDQRFAEALKLMKDRQPQEAQAAFLALAKDFPEFSGPLTDLGILQAQAKQLQPAIENFRNAVRQNPKNWIAQNWLGTLQRERGDFAAAEAAYRGAIAARPDYANAHLNLGLLYDVQLKRPQDALVEYREYQRLAGTDKLIVSAWIREIEDRLPKPAPAAASPAPAPTAPAPTAGGKS